MTGVLRFGSSLIAVFTSLACSKPGGSSGSDAGGAPNAESPAASAPRSMNDADAAAPGAVIGLDGTMALPPGKPRGSPSRIYARAIRTWIYEAPRSGAAKLGVFRAGSALEVRVPDGGRDGCPGGWRGVAPMGWVCVGQDATLDANDPLVRALADFPPDLGRRLPYLYGVVRRPGPIYRRLPSTSELARYEPELPKRMQAWLTASGESGAGYGQQLWIADGSPAPDPAMAWEKHLSDESPWFFAGGQLPPGLAARGAGDNEVVLSRMEPRVGYSILRTFLYEGRRYGITSDLALVAVDRLRPIQGSSFHGYRIPEDIDFPFAIVRAAGARYYVFDHEKNQLLPGEPAPYRSAVRLTGKQNFFRGRLHYETGTGAWLRDTDASRLDPARRLPAWAKNGEKWIDVNITKQTLVLFDGVRPVYATLVSTGEAGLADAMDTTATQRGIFRIHTKFISATMDSDVVGEEFELRDVPYVQYFEKGYALHGAYWHDRFGTPRSHGCINLAPEDARRIFFWTEPTVPAGWHGALKPLRGTVLFVHP
jgi:hypothetical protein